MVHLNGLSGWCGLTQGDVPENLTAPVIDASDQHAVELVLMTQVVTAVLDPNFCQTVDSTRYGKNLKIQGSAAPCKQVTGQDFRLAACFVVKDSKVLHD